jgi:molecular chaperone IbpA
MRTYDFAPLWRSSVGFDRLFNLINDTQRLEGQDNYPPYDIVRTGENAYRISLASPASYRMKSASRRSRTG